MKYVIFSESEYLIAILGRTFGPASFVVSDALDKADVSVISSHAAYKGNYPPALSTPAPLDNTILSLLSRTECLVMRMMDRTEKCENFYYRQKVYRKHLSYWVSLLENVDAVIFQNIPHEVYDFIAYEVARVLNKKTYCFYFLPVVPPLFLSYIVEDIYNHSSHIKALRRSGKLRHSKCLQELRATLDAVYALQDLPIEKRPTHSNKEKILTLRSKNPIIKLRSHLKTFTTTPLFSVYNRILSKFCYYLDPHSETSYILSGYPPSITVFDEIDSLTDFVYFPLHFQPELSSSPIGGYYEDQEMILRNLIDACEKYKKKLVVKLHPRQHQGGLRRNLMRVLTDPNRKFLLVNSSVSTHKLITNACAVVTISGSVGWEALFASKPVLLFGTRLYELLPGVQRVRCARDLVIFFEKELKLPAGRASPKWAAGMELLLENLFVGNVATWYLADNRALEEKWIESAVSTLVDHISRSHN